MKSQRKGQGIALSFFNLGVRWEWVVNATPQPISSHPEKGRPGTHCTGDRVGPRVGLVGCGKSRHNQDFK